MIFVGCSKVDDELDFVEANGTALEKVAVIGNENLAERETACPPLFSPLCLSNCQTIGLGSCNGNVIGVIFPKLDQLVECADGYSVEDTYTFGFNYLANSDHNLPLGLAIGVNECPDKFTWEIFVSGTSCPFYASQCNEFSTVLDNEVEYEVRLAVGWQLSNTYTHTLTTSFTFMMEGQGNCLSLDELVNLEGNRLNASCIGGGTEMALIM